MDECGNPDKQHYPQRLICYKTLELISAQRKYASLHESRPYHDGSFEQWSHQQSADFPFRYDDAVRIWVSDVDYDPDGTWLSASPGGLQDEVDDERGGAESN